MKEKEILQAIGKSYFNSVLIDIPSGSYERTMNSAWFLSAPEEGRYSELVEVLAMESGIKESEEMLREMLSTQYMNEQLRHSECEEITSNYYINYSALQDGETRWYSIHVLLISTSPDGMPEQVSLHTRDVTAQKREEMEYQKKLKEAYELAERANQAKTTFLNNMSHDIRTPMNAIIGFTSLAATHLDEKERLKDYLSKIMVSSNHLLSLINDVLDMSRIESGRVKIEENECSLPVVMHDLRNILQTDIKSKRLDFFIDTVDVETEAVICDRLRLNQILLNCLNNSIKYTNAGGTVGIRIVQKENAPEGYADYDFVVRDTGIGMSEEFTRHIFEPFSREESSTVNRIPGTGLGMSITKSIVDMMGGTIRVKSSPGIGSEITISLRLKTAHGSKKRGVIQELNGFRALVADDSMDSCVSVEKMLRTIGLRPEWTTSGKEAVFRAKYATEQNDPFRVYIIDWLMPDMNGIEVVRRIRGEIGNQVPIIILTAYDWSDIEEEAREAGVTAFCAKPLFLSELYDVLQSTSHADSNAEAAAFPLNEFSGKRILLVEDVELNREIAETILGEAGLLVTTVEDGLQAVNYMESEEADSVDLILMDIMMPVMDGYEATRKIRQLNNRMMAEKPIIAMTANAFEEDVKKALDAGMNGHLAKPIRIETLYKIMKQYLK